MFLYELEQGDFQICISVPLSANFTKWSKILKQFVGKSRMNCLSVSDHFVGLAVKGLKLIFVYHFQALKRFMVY